MQNEQLKVDPGALHVEPTKYVPIQKKIPTFLLSQFPDDQTNINGTQRKECTIVVTPPDGPESQEKSGFWGSIHSVYLKRIANCQHFSNINYFVILYTIPILCQGILYSFVDLSNGIFQKENSIGTFETVIISLAYDISVCVSFPFLLYLLEKENVSRLIALASFLVGVGSLFYGIPYVEIGNNLLYKELEDICTGKKIENTSKKISEALRSKYITCIIIGRILQGLASVFFFIFGQVFLNNTLDKHSTGVYLGIMGSSLFIGYAMGFLLAAHLVNPPKNIVRESNEDYDYAIMWHQTWWRYFICVSILSWSTVIPLLCFRYKKKGKFKIKPGKSTHSLFKEIPKENKLKTAVKDLFAVSLVLIKNPVFVLISLARAFESLYTVGACEFIPTYIEHQFLLSKKTATTISGAILVPGCALGYLLGGIISSHLKLSCKGLIRFTMMTSSVSFVMLVIVMFLHCSSVPFAGLNEDYDGTGQFFNLTAPCNSHCQCLSSFYSPICGRDGVGYFSPCFAGCIKSKNIQGKKAYYNCSCINVGLVTVDEDGEFIDATAEECDSKCHKLPFFMAIFFSMIMFSELSGVPWELVILRTAPEKNCLLTFGLSAVIMKLFGTIPGPILIKSITELSCIFRTIDKSETLGNCWMFNTTTMANHLLILISFCKSLSIVFSLVSSYWYNRLPKENIDRSSIFKKHSKVKRKHK